MPVFVIIPLANNFEGLGKALEAKLIATDFFALQNDAGWLVNYGGTSQELSTFIGITPPPDSGAEPLGSALVVPVPSYYGRGPTTMWEWIKTRMEGGR